MTAPQPSAEIRAQLADEGRPVILAMSRGKDALATWCALADAGVPVIPVHLDLIPGLRFVDESIAAIEQHFGTRVHRLPHPSFYRWLNNYVYTPPERCGVIDAGNFWSYDFADLWTAFRSDQQLDTDTWVATGVRAADSPVRRLATIKGTPWRHNKREVWAIWDWKIADVRQCLADHDVQLPVDYPWFGRSFDGLDARFLAPLRQHAPDDYARVLDWFPLAELAIIRTELEARHAPQA